VFCKEIDRENGNNLWGDAMFVEAQSQIDHTTYLFLGTEEEIPEGYQKVKLRTIFDIKQDLRRKARTIARGHEVDAFDINCHSSNMKGISARLLMLIADANGYDVRVGNIKNAYLYAPTAEKVWTICGPEFSRVMIDGVECNMSGRKALIVKALYGLKSSGRQWHKYLGDILRGLGFKPSQFDSDVWYRLNKDHDLYEYVGTHTDDLLVVGPPGSPDAIIAKLSETFTIKSPGEPTFHLGCDYKTETVSVETRTTKNIRKLEQKGDPKDPLSDPEAQKDSQHDPELKKRYWFLGTKTYVTGALERCADIMQLKPIYKGVRVISPVEQIKKQSTPIVIKNGNHPATDDGELCNTIQHRTYQQLLGIALWIALCGRYDICYAVNVLSAFSAAPKRKHLERVYHLIGYLLKYPERLIMIDSSEPGCVEGEEQYPEAKQREMHDNYPDVIEEINPRAPKPKGKEIKTACFFDAAMGSEMTKGRGHTGITLNFAVVYFRQTVAFCLTSNFLSLVFLQ
jgi:hypothetical protein